MEGRTLTPPSISIITDSTEPPRSETDRPASPPRHHENSLSPTSPTRPPTSHLGVAPPSPTAHSLSGDTLRSRSGSFQSADFTIRTRSSSVNTAVPRTEWDSIDPNEALRPDRGNEADFQVDNSPFAFSQGQLNKLLNPKSLAAFRALGGLNGLAKGLRTDLDAGLSVDETSLSGSVTFEEARVGADAKPASTSFKDVHADSELKDRFYDRIRIFKDNRLPERKADSIWVLIWKAYNDKILILLTIAAVISLALGLYETFSGGSQVDWVEGVAICVAIIIVVAVGAVNDWQKERQFIKLNKRKDDREVKAIRSGKSIQISVYDITVGDVLHLEPGDAIPADGIFISGHGVKCDESSATGESDQMKKTSGHEVWQQMNDGTASKKLDPFIISGSKVLEGVGTFLVTSVGVNSSYGKILMSLQTENEETPLQVKLGRLANWIGGAGSSAALLLFFVLLIRFLAHLSSNEASAAVKGQEFLDILIVAITVIVVAVPEGLPLAVTLALAFATTRMLKENNLVRVLRACETMGNATTICSDKTGTLTQNKMTVVAGTLSIDESSSTTGDSYGAKSSFNATYSKLPKSVKDLFRDSIVLNSTAFEGEEKGVPTFIGSKTETALLTLAKDHLGLDSLAEERSNATIAQLIPFDSARKCMGAVIRLKNGTYRLLVKGAAEILLSRASSALASDLSGDTDVEPISQEIRAHLAGTIESYAEHSLRTIGFLYKDFEQWPPAGAKTLEEDKSMVEFDDIFHDMTWLGVVGIHDPLREGVVEAVAQCQQSGVVVRMVTGDNMTTAKAIATDCGIMTPDALIMEGPEFRQLSDADRNEAIPKLRVLARSSPEDKRILVASLKQLGETVAVTGDGTNDGPALKTADVGFSMGIAGTEVAKEASSIILLDDNFSSTITALMWGRAVNDAVKKFLQFQITVNITAVIITFVSAVSSSSNESVLTAVQLLWINLIMDTLAALALATDAPTKKILDRKPEPKSAPLITINMWKMITGQTVYQLIVTFILYFAGPKIFPSSTSHAELDTMVFNTFTWMQIFNELNNRRLDNKFNVFENVHRNFWFLGINAIMVGGQIMIIFVGGQAFGITKINGWQWGVCLAASAPCLLWAIVLRCIPDKYFGAVFTRVVAAATVILKPIAKGFHIVFHPLAQAFRALNRVTARIFKKKSPESEESTSAPKDEEAATKVHTAIQEEKEVNKSRDEEEGPVSVPPITFTAPDESNRS